MLIELIAILCVVGIAVGQILFKLSAISLSETGSFFALKTFLTLFSAMLLYGITSIAWVWVLQKTDLGRVYPLMAIAFILVPIGSYLIFGERFQSQYFVGVVLIIIGVFTVLKS
jgi:drug/metabolite transporter (DMT)-like permease